MGWFGARRQRRLRVPNRFGATDPYYARSGWVSGGMASPQTQRTRLRRVLTDASEVIRRVASTLIAAAASLVALYLAAVCTAAGQHVEDLAVLGSNVAHSDPSWAQSLLATLAHDSAIVVAIALPLLLGWCRKRLAEGAVLAAAVLAANITTQALKHLVFLRPELGVSTDLGTTNSLPSGTTTLLLSAALATVALLPDPLRRSPLSVALPMLAVVGGCTTIALDWHRPADVSAAVIIVAAWFALAASVIGALTKARQRVGDATSPVTNPGGHAPASDAPAGTRPLPGRILAAGGLCVLAVAILASLPWMTLTVDAHGPVAYALAMGIVLAGSLMVVTALMRTILEQCGKSSAGVQAAPDGEGRGRGTAS